MLLMTFLWKYVFWVKDFSCNCKCKFCGTTCNSHQKWNNEAYWCECKNYCLCTKNYSLNPSTCIYENGKYLEIIADTSVTVCDEIIDATDNVSTNVPNTIPSNIYLSC